jgi:tetratricopeptide (TPR) repeat protein
VARPTPPRPAAPMPKVPPAPRAAPIDPAKRQKSIRQMNEGAKALGQDQFETAIERYGASVATWPENHVSWFYLAYTHSKKRDWAQALAVVANSTRLAPDVAMYRMLHGICLYEAAFHRAREAQAAAQARKQEEIVPDMRAVNQDAALAQLALALHLNKGLWRAHYYLGRIHRDRGDAAVAAESFTRAVQYGPPESAPYVALAELYRRWDYVDHAVMITRLGVNQVVDSNQQADVLYMLGLALDDKQSYDAAIDAYTKAMEARRDLSLALFQRGQDLFRVGKLAAAKADLEAFLTRPGTGGMAFARAVASKLLMEIAAKKP